MAYQEKLPTLRESLPNNHFDFLHIFALSNKIITFKIRDNEKFNYTIRQDSEQKINTLKF